MRTTMAWLAVLLSQCVLGSGCANLVARKVPLEERLCGSDSKYDGFRYYLPRPYVVVADRVEVARNYLLGELVVLENKGVAPADLPELQAGVRLLMPPGSGKVVLLDLEGNRLDADSPEKPGWAVRAVDRGGRTILPVAQTTTGESVKAEKLDLAFRQLKETQKELLDAVKSLAARGAVSGPTALTLLDGGGAPSPPTKPDNFQVVFLPDFEEQMVIRDKNLLAYSKYNLSFADGWQLAGVSGTWDSTEVPVRMLQSISNAISAAASIQKKALTTLPITPEEIAQFGLRKGARDRAGELVLISEIEYIPPGMYRLNKPREATPASGCGFLTELGIPTAMDRRIQLVLAE